jgi:hypothetical protein
MSQHSKHLKQNADTVDNDRDLCKIDIRSNDEDNRTKTLLPNTMHE